MTKDQLIAAMAAKTAKPKVEIGLVLDALRAVVTEAVQRGEEVTVPDLVKLTVQDRPARVGRNPSTGATVDIPARKAVKAKPLASLNRALQP